MDTEIQGKVGQEAPLNFHAKFRLYYHKLQNAIFDQFENRDRRIDQTS